MAVAAVVAIGVSPTIWWIGRPDSMAAMADVAFYSVSLTESQTHPVRTTLIGGEVVYRPMTPLLLADGVWIELTRQQPLPPPRGFEWIERLTGIRISRPADPDDLNAFAVTMSPREGQALAKVTAGMFGGRLLIVVDGEALNAPTVHTTLGSEFLLMFGDPETTRKAFDRLTD